MFPDARFIHVLRDGRAAAYSYALKQHETFRTWPGPYLASGLECSFEKLAVRLASFWKENLEEVDRQDKALGLRRKNILLELTYEELCTDTEAVLGRVCQHIGLDPSRFTGAANQERVESRNQKWQEELDSHLVGQMVAAMEPLLSRKGYVRGIR